MKSRPATGGKKLCFRLVGVNNVPHSHVIATRLKISTHQAVYQSGTTIVKDPDGERITR
jgi:hypothetical protein